MITAEPGTTKVPLVSHRQTSLAAGVLYLFTFVSTPTLFLYDRVKTDSGYITGPGPDTLVIVGGLLEVIVALACIGTGVALYPVVKRQNEGVALGFVGARILEAGAIFAGSWRSCRSLASARPAPERMRSSPVRRCWPSMPGPHCLDKA